MSPDVVWVEIEHITLTADIPARLMSESVFEIVVNKEGNDVRGSAPVRASSFTGLPSLLSTNLWLLQTRCHETFCSEQFKMKMQAITDQWKNKHDLLLFASFNFN